MRPANWLFTISLRLRSLFRWAQADQELDDELRDHLDRATAEYVAKGIAPEEARRRARLALGGMEKVKEECREARRVNWIQDLIQDLRYGLRMLRKSPGFIAVAGLTLALGIACTTAVFSIVNAAMIQPLNYPHADRMVLVWLARQKGGYGNPGAPEYAAFRDGSTTFDQLAAQEQDDFDLRGDPPARLHAARVTPNYFAVVGVQPQLGRVFTENEAASAAHVVVLSYSVWANNFGSDPQIVGRSVALSGEPWTVIGVMPRGFEFIRADKVYVPLDVGRDRQTGSILVIGLLKNGVSATQAQAQLDPIAAQLALQLPETTEGFAGAYVMPLQDFYFGHNLVQRMLWILLGAVGFVLLISCANVSNLLLARGITRQKEIATRIALGASRGRLFRQLLTESLVLAAAGASFGLLFAEWAVRYLAKLPIFGAPGAEPVAIDTAVVGFTAGLGALVTIIFGLLPAWQTSKIDLVSNMKAASAASIGNARHQRLRGAFVIAEIMLSVVLLAGAGLMIRTFMNVAHTSGGFQPQGVLTAQLSLSRQRYPSNDNIRSFYEQTLERVRALPGVTSADVSTTLPLEGWEVGTEIRAEAEPNDAAHRFNANVQSISDTYFQTMRIAMVRGRAFNEQDTANSGPVAIVNEHAARRLFKGQDAIGQPIWHGAIGLDPKTAGTVEVVGVAADVKDEGLDQPTSDDIYLPFDQAPLQWAYLDVRTSGAYALLPSIRAAIAVIDHDQPIEDIATMEQRLGNSLSSRRFSMTLLVVFASIALALAAIGIYGVIAYSVAQRTGELGLRLALGAKPGDLLALVLRNGLKLAIVGSLMGIAGALALTRLMRGIVYGVTTTDPLTFALAVFFILAVAAAAVWIPARRAMRVDPIVALRYE
jgi:putative ABC transport system permease protein